jgi:lipopolysaccharide/colanic/teichoic acid biosynthesis glycosyltransferase
MNNRENVAQERPGQQDGLPLWKRALDLSVIVLLSPALVVIGGMVALIIKGGSEGPLFFRQRRVGYKGRQFTCFKFRTMRMDAETESHRMHTQRLIQSKDPMVKLDEKKDPRLIPLGSLLRAGGLDELPQLINVLRREMSLVGPRPCIPYEYELYEPWHCRRFEATPGLTGLWQVSGKNRTTFNEMVALDIDYAERRSMWLDVQIIFKTLPALWEQYNDLRASKRVLPTPAVSDLRKSAQSFHL